MPRDGQYAQMKHPFATIIFRAIIPLLLLAFDPHFVTGQDSPQPLAPRDGQPSPSPPPHPVTSDLPLNLSPNPSAPGEVGTTTHAAKKVKKLQPRDHASTPPPPTTNVTNVQFAAGKTRDNITAPIFYLVLLDIFILILCATVFSVAYRQKTRSLRGYVSKLEKDLHDKTHYVSNLEKDLRPLEKYKGLADAAQRAQTILAEAQAQAVNTIENAKAAAAALRTEAEQQTTMDKEDAKQRLKDAKDKEKTAESYADERLRDATINAATIIEEANERATEIAGEAYEALKTVEHLKATAVAMKNVLEGYGDQYIIPSYNLLDGLAEEFGFTEAGQQLRNARERIRLMIDNGIAAKCDYVEPVRRTTAIRFVLMAFNGSVDSILSEVRHDNHGTLRQKIEDEFHLVNELGHPFRNARITREYLKVRYAELHWAAVVNQLKIDEREQQRQIREQIREEERAQREFEKVIKEAAHEEEMLRKAMEKIREQVAKASEEQKAKYEDQLRQLGEKLREAEERSQRAISMAQITKSGYVYIISNIGSFGDDIYKIGLTRRVEPEERVRELGSASVPFEFDVHAMIYSEDAPALEHDLQNVFVKKQVNKVNPRKEYFKVSLREIRDEVERRGFKEVRWTMAAAARQYKESVALERAMMAQKGNEDDWAEWMKKQRREVAAQFQFSDGSDAKSN